MTRFYATAFILIALIAFSCTDSDDNTVSPVEPELLGNIDSNAQACRANMRTIASQQVIYFATHDRYAATLEELGMAGITCPECGLEYVIEATECDCSIHCPLPTEPTHGSIINGVATWGPGEAEEELCRNNMMMIANACIYFFSQNERYPDDLEELGITCLNCPTCGDSYIYNSSDETSFYLGCPNLPEPGHGYIDDGVASWTPWPPDPQSLCRLYMRTIVSQEVIYFANHGEYTENMEDIGMAGVVCPECGEPYILAVSGNGDEFYIECGKPSDPTHGYIDNGVASWQDPTEE